MSLLDRDFSIQNICNSLVSAGIWIRRLLAMLAYSITCIFHREIMEGMYGSPGIWLWLGIQVTLMTAIVSIIVNAGVNTRHEVISWFFVLLYLSVILILMT